MSRTTYRVGIFALVGASFIAAGAAPALAASKACVTWADLAKQAMIWRQGGGDLAEISPKLGDQPIVKDMLAKAYATPIQATKEEQNQTIRNFVNAEQLACFTTPATYELQLGG